MTDNEIIKALECCIKGSCDECPAYAMNCGAKVPMAFALALINRQWAEIERLEEDNEALNSAVDSALDIVNSNYQIGRAEAIEQFAKKIQRHCTSIELNAYIDTLVEETVGEE